MNSYIFYQIFIYSEFICTPNIIERQMTINKNNNNTITSNSSDIINWLPGMWVKRPIKSRMNFASSICEQSSAITKSKSNLYSMTWHHAIMLHKYIIIEFSNRNCLRYTAIDDKDLESYRIVKSPNSYFHAQAIITRALSKYGQDIKYQVIKYNCEHFTNWSFSTYTYIFILFL